MSKITLSMSKETNEKLKALAKDDERSLSKYLERGLIYLANIPGGYHTSIPTSIPTPIRRTVIDFDQPAPQPTPPTQTQTTPTRRTVIDYTPPPLSTIEDYEARLCNPDDEFYYRVKEYFLRHKQPERFLTLLQLVNSNPPTPLAKIKEDYIMSIYDALNTPVGYDLTTHEWKDLLSSFKIK